MNRHHSTGEPCRLLPRSMTGDAGASLVEVTVAVLILGAVAVGLVTGFQTAVRSGHVDHAATSNTADLREVFERLDEIPYEACASTGTYQAMLDDALDFEEDTTVVVDAVEHWNLGGSPIASRAVV